MPHGSCKWDARAKAYVPIDAPDEVADVLLSRGGNWKLPILSGVTKTPFLRRDGSICETPGYDAASGLLYKPGNQELPPIPQQPSRGGRVNRAGAARSSDRRVPIRRSSGSCGGIERPIDDPRSPLHDRSAVARFHLTDGGHRQELTSRLTAMLATRQPMPVISQGCTEEELEKRLGAALLAGDTAIALDNCEHPLRGTFLCQALTQQKLNIRVLGVSKNVDTLVNAAIYATGNNLTIVGDLTRRTLICSLDAHCERPELRTFDANVLDTVRTQRGR